ncbi:hypothetical protein WH266_25565, partial [Pseudomonas sp. MYb330]|uniref:hypothetical protein n=1 Tax=Pseudomonas sp. MYb330 TaxID=2745233 RepID=UPI0030B428EB
DGVLRLPSPASRAPTGTHFNPGIHCPVYEAFVMKLKALRPNVADLAGCRTVAVFAKNPFQTQSFT